MPANTLRRFHRPSIWRHERHPGRGTGRV